MQAAIVVIAGKAIETLFGGAQNEKDKQKTKYAHIVCMSEDCRKKYSSCCNACESTSINNCGKFGGQGDSYSVRCDCLCYMWMQQGEPSICVRRRSIPFRIRD